MKTVIKNISELIQTESTPRKWVAGEEMKQLEIGSQAPAFRLRNQDGVEVGLADFAGRNVLVWFFPRAFGKN